MLIITGWWYTYPSEKYEFVSWDDDIHNIWENEKCSKPPISNLLAILRYTGIPHEQIDKHRDGVVPEMSSLPVVQ